ncbi:uncharacterized protein EDB93DRAFT_1108817 [Suillus bovinus]|uniref:uncharacterized protein n=1 Tax=Suillus bovinus TaxID=48563 RepID=UPI001B86E850|nr:uncharacterized protein EDB93DRAFT_1108817 [Suillus bovinus]KAG2129037.1 hypothetical protein EDB93DRAFT_1108817 [Suillus bovinus]
MSPPHNRLSHRSRHSFSPVEPQYSIETVIPVHEDGLGSLDRIRSASVDGLNQGLKSPEEPEIEPVDCTPSSSSYFSDEQATSTMSSFSAGDLSVGPPQHAKEGHLTQRSVITSTSVIKETVYMTVSQALTTLLLSASQYSTLLSPTPTSSHFTTSSTTSTSQCNGVSCSPSTTTYQTSAQQSFSTGSSYIIYPTSSTLSNATVSSNADTSATTTATTTMTSLQSVLPSSSVSLSSTVVISSTLAHSTAVPDTNSKPQSPSPSYTAAIVGGVVGALALLALLIFIAIWYRGRRRLSVTPFIFPSITTTTQTGSNVWLQSQGIRDAARASSSIGDIVRPSGIRDAIHPSSRGPSSIYSQPCLVEYPGNRCPPVATDSVSFRSPENDNDFSSVIILRQQSNGLENLDPYPSHARTSDHDCHSSVANWLNQVVMESPSPEPSEVLPAYRSTKSLKNGKAGHDDYDIPLLP